VIRTPYLYLDSWDIFEVCSLSSLLSYQEFYTESTLLPDRSSWIKTSAYLLM
jgi:hypothetical protein